MSRTFILIGTMLCNLPSTSELYVVNYTLSHWLHHWIRRSRLLYLRLWHIRLWLWPWLLIHLLDCFNKLIHLLCQFQNLLCLWINDLFQALDAAVLRFLAFLHLFLALITGGNYSSALLIIMRCAIFPQKACGTTWQGTLDRQLPAILQ